MPSPLIINGESIVTAATFPVHAPYDGALLGEFSLGDRTHLTAAIDAAHACFTATTARQAPYERSALLCKVAAALNARRLEFVDLLIREAGKPRTLAEAEVTRATNTFQLAAELARETPGHLLDLDAFASGQHHFGFVRHFPLGVIYAVTPFNFPLNLVAHKLGPALATGNTVVLKPSPRTPLIAALLVNVLHTAGMPAGQVNLVTCSNDEAAAPLADDRVKLFSFTGSAPVGWHLRSLCRKQKVVLELGGNAGAIVHADADLDFAIPALATASFAYAGQTCISTQRIYVHDSIYETFRTRFLDRIAEAIHTGDPTDARVTVGPMISADAVQRIAALLATAQASGATLLTGGTVTGQCLAPTVLEVKNDDLPLCTEELFAPVVTLHRYTDFPSAIRAVNTSRYGLQAGVFTQDIGRIFTAYRDLDVGAVLINQTPTFRAEGQPYGGLKDSGTGREGVRYAMEEMTELKSLIFRQT